MKPELEVPAQYIDKKWWRGTAAIGLVAGSLALLGSEVRLPAATAAPASPETIVADDPVMTHLNKQLTSITHEMRALVQYHVIGSNRMPVKSQHITYDRLVISQKIGDEQVRVIEDTEPGHNLPARIQIVQTRPHSSKPEFKSVLSFDSKNRTKCSLATSALISGRHELWNYKKTGPIITMRSGKQYLAVTENQFGEALDNFTGLVQGLLERANHLPTAGTPS